MLRVLCSETELAEEGETIAVGQRLRRTAARYGSALGGELAGVDWWFDRYAEGNPASAVTISGVVASVHSVHVRLMLEPGRGLVPRPGSTTLTPLTSTADARQPVQEVQWGPPTAPDEHGDVHQGGWQSVQPGDESLMGWLILLDGEEIAPFVE